MSLSQGTHERLLKAAEEAMKRAYVPYSKFQVGAALLDAEGNVHYGCNIENAAYSPTNCAERTALFRAIADGHAAGSFKAIAVIGDTPGPITPCGVCRQVISELCSPDMPVIMGNLKGDIRVSTVSELLPGAFTPRDLEYGKKDNSVD
ncbi:cytidine deaminase [Cohnella lubricantis]|uniref:Cytidine deaminase n=1 Tax=Cohnella lubricantis TaxID=2163172 RepID=A0A841TFK6_9BACL|nr:cytidine deaminase [Cohnella lubricantis]MBB6678739.1 cytidine deaminase [Cohnella lubricantis]MBP2119807.1 cytidine deaminase [Cohnella lubricantis]